MASRSDWSDRARRGDGPAFLLCNTYRYHGHHVGDINREYYRSKQEEQNLEDGARSDHEFREMADRTETRRRGRPSSSAV